MLEQINIKEPNSQFVSQFFHPNLLQSKPYKLELENNLIKLDQNESPFDWPADIKKEITQALCQEPWNTYPQDYPQKLKEALALSLNISPENIILSPGSNYHITVLLNMFATRGSSNKIIITRPSFPLFEGHCRYQNIPYEVWPLNKNFEYDLTLLPKLTPGSCVFFASPNNPVGNSLKKKDLVSLLEKNPDCYFIADEAYWEFSEQNMIELLQKFSNLLIVRTFSKAMGSAGIRFSYILASKILCEQIKKNTLPFIINKFTSIAMTTALKNKEFMSQIKTNVNYLKKEKEKIYNYLQKKNYSDFFHVINSQTNFLCFVCKSESILQKIQMSLKEHKIIIRNVSGAGLPQTLRVTIGKKEDNMRVLNILDSLFERES